MSSGDELESLVDEHSCGDEPAPAKPTYSPSLVFLLCVASIASSVAIILLNKVLMQRFRLTAVFTLTFLHLATTSGAMGLLSGRLFTPKHLPWQQNLLVAAMGVVSISFMNFSLSYNSVGLYQVSKLATVVCILAIKFVVSRETVSRKVLFTLALILLGVGLATVTEVRLSPAGLAIAAVAVVSTGQFHIWQGSKQKEYGLDAYQITDSIAPWQAIMTFALAAAFEFRENMAQDLPPLEYVLIVLSCLCAVVVNLASFALIGKTSAVTYQVVGHFKTVLVLLGGYLFFFDTSQVHALAKNSAGSAVAILGVVLYGHVTHKQSAGEPDVFDRCRGR